MKIQVDRESICMGMMFFLIRWILISRRIWQLRSFVVFFKRTDICLDWIQSGFSDMVGRQ